MKTSKKNKFDLQPNVKELLLKLGVYRRAVRNAKDTLEWYAAQDVESGIPKEVIQARIDAFYSTCNEETKPLRLISGMFNWKRSAEGRKYWLKVLYKMDMLEEKRLNQKLQDNGKTNV